MQAASSIPQHSSVYQIVTETDHQAIESGVAPRSALTTDSGIYQQARVSRLTVFLLVPRVRLRIG
jgi:hypothetical protein